MGRALRETAALLARLEDEVAARFGLEATRDRDELLARLDALLGE